MLSLKIVILPMSLQQNSKCDAFITGTQSSTIPQHLVENSILTLIDMAKQAHALDSAQKNAENYSSPVPQVNAIVDEISPEAVQLNDISSNYQKLNTPKTITSKTNYNSQKCWYFGNKRHKRFNCPAKDTYCSKCGIKGHYGEVPLSKGHNESTTASLHLPTSACTTSVTTPLSLQKSMCKIYLNNSEVNALFDSGSSESFIHPRLLSNRGLKSTFSLSKVFMASTSVAGTVRVDIKLNDTLYSNVKLSIMNDLCVNVILGLDFQSQHQSITLGCIRCTT